MCRVSRGSSRSNYGVVKRQLNKPVSTISFLSAAKLQRAGGWGKAKKGSNARLFYLNGETSRPTTAYSCPCLSARVLTFRAGHNGSDY